MNKNSLYLRHARKWKCLILDVSRISEQNTESRDLLSKEKLNISDRINTQELIRRCKPFSSSFR